jgi:uncharacterized GH25 family protein
MRRPRLLLALWTSAVVAAAVPAAAHDFWIEASTYRPAPLQRVVLRLRVGEHFLGDPVARDPSLLVRFVAADGEGERPVPGLSGRDPAGIAQAPASGTLVVAYESRGSIAEMTAEKAASFAADEGVAAQLPSGWQRKPLLRDEFTRSVKSLLLVRGASGTGFDRVVGLPLELVPLVDPAALTAGGPLPLRLLWRGKPGADIQVAALSRLDPSRPVVGRTDADGKVTLVLPRGGEWLVKAVRIVPPTLPAADLGSVWTSLTFRAGDP